MEERKELMLTEEELRGIREQEALRDKAAMELGVLTVNYERDKGGILLRIARSEQTQKDIGERLLRSYGINPDKEQYTIDSKSGSVMILREGKWEPVERE